MGDLSALVADVSGWQQSDVSSLANDGFLAVIPKYTEDTSSASGARAHAQCASARSAGMKVFAGYDFALGSNGAAQCDALIAALGDDDIHRAVCDAEVNDCTIDVVVSFGRRAREWNPTVRPILYASTSFMASHYGGVAEIADLYEAWIAAYTGGYTPTTHPLTPPPRSPAPFGDYIGWQFTSVFPSSIGHIDASVFDAAVLAEPGPTPAPAPPPPLEDDVLTYITKASAKDDGSPESGLWVTDQIEKRHILIDEYDFMQLVGTVPKAVLPVSDQWWDSIPTAA